MDKQKEKFTIVNSRLLQEHHVKKLLASINKRFPGRKVAFGKAANGDITVDPGEPIKIVKAPRKNANNFKFSSKPVPERDTRSTLVAGLSMPGASAKKS